LSTSSNKHQFNYKTRNIDSFTQSENLYSASSRDLLRGAPHIEALIKSRQHPNKTGNSATVCTLTVPVTSLDQGGGWH